MIKKITCKVCGHEQEPKRQYTAEAFFYGMKYDCMDCDKCGCQIKLTERNDIAKVHILARGLVDSLNEKQLDRYYEDDLK